MECQASKQALIEITQPHDKIFRSCAAFPEVARNLLETHLPLKFLSYLDLNNITIFSETHVNRELKLSSSDVVYRIGYNNYPGHFYVIVEHQSQAKWNMPHRAVGYQMATMDRVQLQQKNKKRKYSLVYTLVVYHDEVTPYPYANDIRSQIDAPSGLIASVWGQEFGLRDLTVYEDNQLLQQGLIGILEYVLKYSRTVSFDPYFPVLIQLLRQQCVPDKYPNAERFVETVLLYVLNTVNLSRTIYEQHIVELYEPVWKGDDMTIAEQLRAEGRQEGRQETYHEVIVRMLQQGMQLDFIASVLKVSTSEIEQIAQAQ